uniref:Hydantoinase_B domain-containing protein n=1 Tax=Heterorhabditis bacteriophora TaxID=37862 RepID=A0A1I7XEA0_HETBA
MRIIIISNLGCMNNVTFGDSSMGYYETIAGGAGAGKGFDGRSGVHTHMTNTRITDPEILESRHDNRSNATHTIKDILELRTPGGGGYGEPTS